MGQRPHKLPYFITVERYNLEQVNKWLDGKLTDDELKDKIVTTPEEVRSKAVK